MREYSSMLEEEAVLTGAPADLLKAICWHVSGWRQFEPDGRPLTTPGDHGTTVGCMQLNDIWHPDAFPDAKNDARANIRYAANLLIWLHEQTGNWQRATIAYFGHDRRAETAARRVSRYAIKQPWLSLLGTPQHHDELLADYS